jgi:signal peptidase I
MSRGGRSDAPAGGAVRRVRPLRFVTSAIATLTAVGCAAVLLAVVVGHAAVLTVPSPSMTPAIPVGAAIAAEPARADDLSIGDVIVFRSPGADHLTVHRIVQIDGPDGDRTFQTKGDANSVRDPWKLRLDGSTVHRVRHVVPHLGRVLGVVHSREIRLGLLALGSALFIANMLRVIWRRPAPAESAELQSDASSRPGAVPQPAASPRARRRAQVIAAAATAALVVGATGEAQAAMSVSTGSVMPVSSAALGTPADVGCAWASATTLTFVWTPNTSGAPAGTRLTTSTTAGGTFTTAATVTPATTTTTTISPTTPLTTTRFYRLMTYRGSSWTGAPTAAIGSNGCRGAISTTVGTGTAGLAGDGGSATSAGLNGPRGMAYGPSGDLYVADTANNRIRRVSPTGTISTFAGGPAASACSFAGNVASLGLNQPYDVEVDGAGNVYVADTGANCVRRIDTLGNVTRVAGGGATTTCNSTGAASSVSLSSPRGIDVDASGAVYIADSSRNCIRKVVGSTYSFVAGGGATTTCNSTGAATAVSLSVPNDVDVDASGAVYVADTGRNCIRKVVGSTYSFVLGGGATTTCNSTGAASSVALSTPEGLVVDTSGRVLVAESGRRCVRAVTGSTYSQVALTGTSSSVGDNGPAVAATMLTPSGILIAPGGDLLVSDRSVASGGSEVRTIVGPWPI